MPVSEQWYLPTQDKACDLYVEEYGEGRPVIVLHGGPGMSHVYLLDALVGDSIYELEPDVSDHITLTTKNRFVFYDQRGCLLSPCDLKHVSLDANIEDLHTLRASLGDEKAILIAHSAGSLLALYYLKYHPEHVAGLILICGLPPINPNLIPIEYHAGNQPWANIKNVANQKIKELKLDRDDLSPKEETLKWRVSLAAGNILNLGVERLNWMRGGRVYYNEDVALAVSKDFHRDWDFKNDLCSIPIELTCINAAYDASVPMHTAYWRNLAKEVPNLESVIIEEAGHAAWLDQPSAFRQALQRALAKYE